MMSPRSRWCAACAVWLAAWLVYYLRIASRAPTLTFDASSAVVRAVVARTPSLRGQPYRPTPWMVNRHLQMVLYVCVCVLGVCWVCGGLHGPSAVCGVEVGVGVCVCVSVRVCVCVCEHMCVVLVACIGSCSSPHGLWCACIGWLSLRILTHNLLWVPCSCYVVLLLLFVCLLLVPATPCETIGHRRYFLGDVTC